MIKACFYTHKHLAFPTCKNLEEVRSFWAETKASCDTRLTRHWGQDQEGHIGDVLPAVMFCRLTSNSGNQAQLSRSLSRSRSLGGESLEVTIQGIYQYIHSAYPLLNNRDGVRRKHSMLHKSDTLLKVNCIQPFRNPPVIWSTLENRSRIQSFPLLPSYFI